MTLLALSSLTVRLGARAVVDGVDLTVSEGEFVGLLGPNGAGKTTLLRAALGLERFAGASDLAALPPAARARRAAFLPQRREIAWPMPVEAVVALARPRDPGAVDRVIARLELEPLRRRIATELSGGEQARVLIARALAQEAPLLIADEPTAGLDPAAQLGVMEVFAGLASAGGAVIASLHDPGLAVRHCSRLVVLDRGRVAADGPPAVVLTDELLARVFGIRAWRAETPEGPVFQPIGRVPR